MKKPLNIGLQYFAEQEQESEQQTPPEENQTPAPEVDPQKMAEKIADTIVARKLKGMPTKDELKAFKDWQESQKTPEQLESEEQTAIRKERDELKKRVTEIERKGLVLESKVNPAFADFVTFEASKLTTEENDFKAALQGFLKQHPEYSAEAVQQPAAWGSRQEGSGSTKLSGVEESFKKLNPNLEI